MRLFYFAGFLAGTAIRAAVRPSPLAAENETLRDRVASLEAQRDYLIADAEEAARAEAMRRHPAGSMLPADDDLAELAAVDTLGDILWVHGEEWSK